MKSVSLCTEKIHGIESFYGTPANRSYYILLMWNRSMRSEHTHKLWEFSSKI